MLRGSLQLDVLCCILTARLLLSVHHPHRRSQAALPWSCAHPSRVAWGRPASTVLLAGCLRMQGPVCSFLPCVSRPRVADLRGKVMPQSSRKQLSGEAEQSNVGTLQPPIHRPEHPQGQGEHLGAAKSCMISISPAGCGVHSMPFHS